MIEPKQTADPATGFITGQVLPFPAAAASHRPRLEPSTLTFTWAALERQLVDLAVTSKQRALVRTLVSGTRKQAPFKSSEMVLREVLCIASVLMDETFHPEMEHPESEEGEMT